MTVHLKLGRKLSVEFETGKPPGEGLTEVVSSSTGGGVFILRNVDDASTGGCMVHSRTGPRPRVVGVKGVVSQNVGLSRVRV